MQKAQYNKDEYIKNVNERMDSLVNKLIQAIENGNLVDMVSHKFLKAYGVPSDNWSLGNYFLMLLAGTKDARSYLAWQKLGYSVKGAKAFYIIQPILIDIVAKDENNNIIYENNKPKKISKLVGFKPHAVFRVEDIKPLSNKTTPIKYVEEPKLLPDIMAISQKFGIKINLSKDQKSEGSYFPTLDQINIASENIDVFFHELAHAIQNRLFKLKAGQDIDQEIEAELAAQILTSIYYPDHQRSRSAVNYIEHYAKKESKKAVQKILENLANVKKIVSFIMEKMD